MRTAWAAAAMCVVSKWLAGSADTTRLIIFVLCDTFEMISCEYSRECCRIRLLSGMQLAQWRPVLAFMRLAPLITCPKG